ncbi:MAG: undecaprenyl/decaprenyl-phosphate alpha-N-acetylglucosaminyl 1-phosphate transferase [Spirochaetaceae bacterium]|nr:MAG: undecaprenyl/decaprenyl-phosphate alpha-N-acetylglucosaminyl 1-phosphate transferase [Spirochaetaceae bacterium]
MTIVTALVPLIAGLSVTALAIPGIITLAHRKRWYDERNHRKIHVADTPRIGGVGIFGGFVAAIALSLALVAPRGDYLTPVWAGTFGELWPLGIGILLVHALGLYDDFRGLRAALKLMIQIAAAVIVTLGPYRIESITIPFVWIDIGLGPFSHVITVVWIVAITNALNFIDGVDGLAAGTAAIAALAFAAIAVIVGQSLVALVALGLVGALVGFLLYNSPPARIFMGDSGAYVLGFALAVLPLMTRDASGRTMSLLPALTVLALPALDMTTAVFRRLRRGKHPFSADREHIHHKLMDLGLQSWSLLMVAHGSTIVMGAVAVAWYLLPQNTVVASVLVAWAVAAILTGVITRRQHLGKP